MSGPAAAVATEQFHGTVPASSGASARAQAATQAAAPARQIRVNVEVASTAAAVRDAWGLVYRSYVASGLIDPNPRQIHTVPQALQCDVAVVVGRLSDGRPVTSGTCMGDGPLGLPLDCVYRSQLDRLRQQGRHVCEIGLLADDREAVGDASSVLFDALRYTFHFGLYLGVSDFVCGMHPRRARLYNRLFGFEVFGDARIYSTVKNHPVVLMRAQTDHLLADPSRYRAVEYFVANPVARQVFAQRYRFPAWAAADPFSTIQWLGRSPAFLARLRASA